MSHKTIQNTAIKPLIYTVDAQEPNNITNISSDGHPKSNPCKCFALPDHNTLQAFDAECITEKEKLDAAGKARECMEKASNTENEVVALSTRWEAVKKVSEERVEKVSKAM